MNRISDIDYIPTFQDEILSYNYVDFIIECTEIYEKKSIKIYDMRKQPSQRKMFYYNEGHGPIMFFSSLIEYFTVLLEDDSLNCLQET